MKVKGRPYKTIWLDEQDQGRVQIIDQTQLPHAFVIETIASVQEMANAIRNMHVRGAILIGVAAAYGIYLAAREAALADGFETALQQSAKLLKSTRPTAVNLAWAVDLMLKKIIRGRNVEEKVKLALAGAQALAEDEDTRCQVIGERGLEIIRRISREKNGALVNILTHCNAGWLACVDFGTATAPIYAAQQAGIPVHVWVDETRPWNQGSRLTAWELGEQGVAHTVIADNTGGHLMQHGLVDLVIVGADRVTRRGDVANKIGTYLKALAAHANHVPFYVAFPSSTFDFNLTDGLAEIPIEERGGEEVRTIQGLGQSGIETVLLTPPASPAVNYGFDVTPAKLITGLITERGICPATEHGILKLYPEKKWAGT